MHCPVSFRTNRESGDDTKALISQIVFAYNTAFGLRDQMAQLCRCFTLVSGLIECLPAVHKMVNVLICGL